MSEPGLLTVTHRRYVGHAQTHYGGGLLDGAFVLGLFGDAATELAIREGGDEGLLAGYRRVTFHAPIQAGDVVEVQARLLSRGRRSREVGFTAYVCCRSDAPGGPSAARVLDPALLVASAEGTVVLPG